MFAAANANILCIFSPIAS